MPIPPILIAFWLIGLLSLLLLGSSGWLIWEWYDNWVRDLPANPRFLIGGLVLLTLGFLGRPLVLPFLGRKLRAGEEDPRPLTGGTIERLTRPDGTVLHIEAHGPGDAPVLLFTHGWGLSSAEWFYAKQHLGDRYRLLLWDLPGLGQSREAQRHDRDLRHFAGDLNAVLDLAGDRPVLLCGHSIGGMITLTFCRLFPERLSQQVKGIVLIHTTYTNPVNTAPGARFLRPLQRFILSPMCSFTLVLSPLMRVTNFLCELNGSAHILNHFMQFGRQETSGQLRFFTSLGQRANPAVVARGMQAMMDYDALDILPQINVPTLIIAASGDKATLPAASDLMATTIPQAKQVTLAPAGHLGLIEHHEEWARAVSEFAEACLKRG
ncbi:alpha/beta fold hydrolase [Deinococcus sp. Leaf326]|uniref:alpha/beta fold hydrolase n=1 Tax=Deinococcus sp. Leaf326 TaxID=1736338 RepID=UPI000A6C3AF3|nr:alpha/beta hydrolase [Deinococcus sp. Leaf326]